MGKRIGIYIIGLAITALGITFVINAGVGAGPWDIVAVGLTNLLGLTVGTWSIISQATFLLITKFLEKSRLRIESIIPIVIRSIFLDIWIYVVFKNADFFTYSLGIQWLNLCLGIIISGVGIGIYMEARFPKTPIDGLMVALSNRFGWSLGNSRLGIEVTGAILGALLKGPIGIGTVIIALVIGKVIQYSNSIVKRMLHTQVEPMKTA